MAISYFLKADIEQEAYNRPMDDLIERFQTSKSGLTRDVANERIKAAGSNEIPKSRLSVYQKYIKPVVNLMMLILLLAAIVQLYFVYTYQAGSYLGPVIVLAVLLLNIIVGMRQQYKAEKTLEALERLTAFTAKIYRDGEITEISADKIVPGDIISLTRGDYIPADARLIEVNDFSVNESILTGEIVPVEKHTRVIEGTHLQIQDQLNMVFNSTYVSSGNAKALVVGTGIHTEIGKISKGVANKQRREIPLQRQMNRLAMTLGFMVIIVVIGLFLFRYFTQGTENMISGISWLISLAVAAIPFNFPIITTLILLSGVMHLADKQAIVRNLNAVESMGRLTYICTDKTGTLTQNEMTVEKIFYDSKQYTVEGIGYQPEGRITHLGKQVDILEDLYLWKMVMSGIVNNNSHFTEEEIKIKKGTITQRKVLGMPTEGALLVLAGKAGIKTDIERQNYTALREFSFSSDRKRMTKIVQREGKLQAFTKGAVEILLDRSAYTIENGDVVPLSDAARTEFLRRTQSFAELGLRTLGFAYTNLDDGFNPEMAQADQVERNLVFLGLVGIIDPPRPGVPEAVQTCLDAGIKVAMITGDHPTTAMAIARQTNVFQEGDLVATGKEVGNLSPEQIMKTSIFSRVAPEDKQTIVNALQSEHQIVAMTGDGVNDTLALENADVGIAMGLNGTDVAKNAADLVLTDDSFTTIATALYHGRGLFTNIRSNIVFLLVCNLMEVLILTVVNLAYGGAEFLNSFQLVILYGTIHFFPPIGLIFDKYSQEIMKEPPKRPKEPLINKSYMFMMVLQILVIAVLLFGMWHAVMKGVIQLGPENIADLVYTNPISGEITTGYVIPGEGYVTFTTDPDLFVAFKAQSMCFVTLVFAETWVALECRSNKRSFLNNKFNLVLTIMLSLVLAILVFITQYPVAQSFLNILPLSTGDWIICLVASLVVPIITEVLKAVNRKKKK